MFGTPIPKIVLGVLCIETSYHVVGDGGESNMLIRDGGGFELLLPPMMTLLEVLSTGAAGVIFRDEGMPPPRIVLSDPSLPACIGNSFEGVVEREMGGEKMPTPLRASEALVSIGIGKGNQIGSPRCAGLPRRAVSEDAECVRWPSVR